MRPLRDRELLAVIRCLIGVALAALLASCDAGETRECDPEDPPLAQTEVCDDGLGCTLDRCTDDGACWHVRLAFCD